MYILGISAFFHDSAACLLRDGEIVAAAQEERFSRIKHDARFPRQAIEACLRQAGITLDDVHFVGFYEKPHLKLERILRSAGASWPRGWQVFREAFDSWTRQKFRLPAILRDNLLSLSPTAGARTKWDGRLIFAEHHYSHAASAYFPSPFETAAVMTLDGVGEWSTTALAVGRCDDRGVPRLEFLRELRYPHSLGMLYSAFTYYLGFKVGSGEYKVMGLAPYGEPRYVNLILDRLVDLRDDGSFALNTRYFSFQRDRVMLGERFARLFDLPLRRPDDPLTQRHFDIAASIQKVAEQIILRSAFFLHRETGLSRLCLAGGVALNCVANGLLLREGPFDDVWVQPAAGDAGGAIGVAYYIWHEVLGRRRATPADSRTDLMQGALLGPDYSTAEIRDALGAAGLPFEEIDDADLSDRVAELVAQERVVGWFQGRMEFGPRALGARSILGDARSPRLQRVMNLKIKHRESFRPFAPVVLREKAGDWFDLQGREGSLLGAPGAGYDSPYMSLVAPVRSDKCRAMSDAEQRLFGIDKLNIARSDIPAATHVDYSARVQTVSQADHPRFHELLRSFERLTGVPVLVNTSFNVRGEPIVCSPVDAIRCFLGTDIDILCLGNYLVDKRRIAPELLAGAEEYRREFSLD